MIEPLKTEPIIVKLLEKTRKGRVDWIEWGNGYRCSLDEVYYFVVSRVEDSFLLSMNDELNNQIFQEIAREELYYGDPRDQERVEMFRDLYELARRKALNADAKIADALSSLEKI
jgi:hypothetical protein